MWRHGWDGRHGRSFWCASEDLGVDDLRGAAVLGGEPVISQVQIDPGRLDRGVPGLGLDRLQRHPGLPQSGQAGVTQLVAGRVRQPRPRAGAVQHLVEAVGAQRPTPPGALEHQEHRVRVGVRGPLLLEVGAQVLEESRGDRHKSLVAALALGDEQPPLRGADVLQAQPEDLAASQATEQHRSDHGPVPVRAQRRGEGVDLDRGQDPRQRPSRRPHQRNAWSRPVPFPSGRQPTRDRVHRDVASGGQERVQPCDRGQSTTYRAQRHPDRVAGDRTEQRVRKVWGAAALSGDKPQHIRRRYRLDRPVHNREEHLQVEPCGQHRVRSTTPGQELQIRNQQRIAERLLPRLDGRNQTRHRARHAGPPRGERTPQRRSAGDPEGSPTYQACAGIKMEKCAASTGRA